MNTATRLMLTGTSLVLAAVMSSGCNFPGRAGECLVDDDCPYSTDTCYDHFCFSPQELADLDIIDLSEVDDVGSIKP